MTSHSPDIETATPETQDQSTGVRDEGEGARLRNRGGLTDFEMEPGELEPIVSPENEALDSERRSFELKRRQVQMMAFGIISLSSD